MQIESSNAKDIPAIFKRYKEATAYQKKRFHRHWPIFERGLIEKEIREHRQWKIVLNEE